MLKILIFVLLSICVKNVFGANILHISLIPSPSHHIWNRALAFGLVQSGHNVTLIGPDQDKIKPTNYTHLYTEGVYEDLHGSLDMIGMAKWSPATMLRAFVDMSESNCKAVLKSQGLQKLLNYPTDFFDLIIFDVSMGPCLISTTDRFKYPPTLAVTPFLLSSYVAFDFGNHVYPAYLPWYGAPYTQNMSFVERFWNFFYVYYDVILRHFKQATVFKAEKKVFGEDVPSLDKLKRHISLILTNTDPILDRPQPLAPNFIPVGGLHTRRAKEIPQDLLSILDNAKNGVIVFSLGSNVRSDMLEEKTQNALIDAFGKISETVIWKFESEIKNLPKNVIVRKWLPQNDILGHPNVKLFIGHGGGLSTQEAMFHGVPIICIPFFMDQRINTRNVVDRKLGISIDFEKITSGYVLQKIREILDNPIYSKNMRKASRLYNDRTETPLERAIFWVEYVLRNEGANFLSTPARDVPFYVSSGFDIIGFLILIAVVILLTVCKVVLSILKLFTRKKKVKLN